MPSKQSIRNQEFFTKVFLAEEFGNNEIPDTVVDKFRKLWWSNPIKRSSLKLSKVGYAYVKNTLHLTQYETDITELLPAFSELISYRDILTYTKGLNGPWHIKGKTLILFDSKDAMLMGLYGPERFKTILEKRNSK